MWSRLKRGWAFKGSGQFGGKVAEVIKMLGEVYLGVKENAVFPS